MSTSDVALPEDHVSQDAEQDAEQPPMPDLNADEVRARQTGWVSKQEWEEQGKDPSEWISAARYNEKGEMIDTIKGLKKQVKNVDERIANNNAIWAAKLQADRERLMDERNAAIDDADKDKVNRLDKEIHGIDQQAAQIQMDNQRNAQQADPADLAVENHYFSTLTRGQQAFAQQVAAPLVNNGLTGQALVDAVQREVDKEFTPTNPRRSTPSKTDSGRKAGGRDDALTMDNLTVDDKRALNALKRTNKRYASKSDSELLKILKDSKL